MKSVAVRALAVAADGHVPHAHVITVEKPRGPSARVDVPYSLDPHAAAAREEQSARHDVRVAGAQVGAIDPDMEPFRRGVAVDRPLPRDRHVGLSACIEERIAIPAHRPVPAPDIRRLIAREPLDFVTAPENRTLVNAELHVAPQRKPARHVHPARRHDDRPAPGGRTFVYRALQCSGRVAGAVGQCTVTGDVKGRRRSHAERDESCEHHHFMTTPLNPKRIPVRI